MTQPVVYIITKLELGGAQKVCLSLFNELQQHQTQTFLITSMQGPLVKQVRHLPNVFLLPSLKREIGFKGIINEIRALFHMILILKKLKKKYPKILVHTHSTKAGIIGRWAAFFAGIKKRIHTVHGFAFHNHQPRLTWHAVYIAEWLTSLITTHFVCVSSHDINTGKKLFPHFEKKHSLIRAAVEQKQFYMPARKADIKSSHYFVFGTVACFKPQKNIFDLLQAFELMHTNNPATRLELIGDGILRPHITQWIAERNLEKVITLHGWQDNVAPLMITWNAFVLTSLWEGLPCAIIEARLLKLPVLSYKTGGITDVIQHGKNGLLFEQKNWHNFADGMHQIATNAELYTRLKYDAESLHEFSHQYMAKKHALLYRQLHQQEVQ